MRVAQLSVSFLIFLPHLMFPQSASVVPRDSQATALLQGSVRAMGGNAPSDSVATGTVVIVAGSLTSSGTVRILTRGSDQTSEQLSLSLSQSSDTTVYSRGVANAAVNGTTQNLSLERTASCQSAAFPLPYLAAALANPDEAIQYVGVETLGQAQAQHIRIWNTFSSNLSRQFLSDFTVTDIWVDAATNLPRMISFARRDGGGAQAKIPIAFSYSDFRSASGILYPYQIQESVNGTPWATISIQSVSFNAGLTDADFPVVVGGN
jgi:hypothetical protein